MHPVIYESINSEIVKDAIKKIKGAVVPSGMDAAGWRRIPISGNFGRPSKIDRWIGKKTMSRNKCKLSSQVLDL